MLGHGIQARSGAAPFLPMTLTDLQGHSPIAGTELGILIFIALWFQRRFFLQLSRSWALPLTQSVQHATDKFLVFELLYFAWVVDDAKCIVVTRVCVSVCLSAAVRPHYCTDPDVTWGRGRGCPLAVHCWADLQSVHGLRCYGDITWNLVYAGCARVAD